MKTYPSLLFAKSPTRKPQIPTGQPLRTPLKKTYLVELSPLLLELFVFVSHNLTFFFELVAEQVLQILPQFDHLARLEFIDEGLVVL